MSLTTAMIVLAIELVIAMTFVFTTHSRPTRARRLVRLFGIYTAVSALWAFGLAGSYEVTGQNANSTWIAVSFAVVNCIVFVTMYSARERMKYGSYPA